MVKSFFRLAFSFWFWSVIFAFWPIFFCLWFIFGGIVLRLRFWSSLWFRTLRLWSLRCRSGFWCFFILFLFSIELFYIFISEVVFGFPSFKIFMIFFHFFIELFFPFFLLLFAYPFPILCEFISFVSFITILFIFCHFLCS